MSRVRVVKVWLGLGLVAVAALGWWLVSRPGVYQAAATITARETADAIRDLDRPGTSERVLGPLRITGRPELSIRGERGAGAHEVRIVVAAPDPQLAADVAQAAAGVLVAGDPATRRLARPAATPRQPQGRGPLPLLLLAAAPLVGLPVAVLAARRRRTGPEPPPAAARALRTDIEGVRAIAVSTVVLWHAGIPWLPGGFTGVDMFFVISGYLMSGVLLRQVAREGRVSLTNFYARRARRLLPAALTALVGASIITLGVVPASRWPAVGRDIVASATYVVNWRMAAQSVDYLSADVLPSPVQHYWSLSVEEQFYLVWPLLALGCAVAAGRRGWRVRRVLLGASVVVFAASFAASILWTARSGPSAYFVTPTRMWELALGSIVACTPALFRRRLGARGLRSLTWLGLMLLVLATVLVTAGDPFPGWIALLPTLGAALVIWSGAGPDGGMPGRILAAAPMQWLGKLSYSIYLWHWPFIVIALAWTGRTDHPPVAIGLAAALASLVPAWLSFRLIEDPVRRNAERIPRPQRDRASLYLGLTNSLAALVAGVIVVVAAWPATGQAAQLRWQVPPEVFAARGPMGAVLLGDRPSTSPAGEVRDQAPSAIPPLDRVAADTGTVDSRDPCTTDLDAEVPVQCPVGDPRGSRLVVVVGDSHAKQWLPALDTIGKERGWRVVGITKSSCPPLDGLVLPRAGQPGGYTQCVAWNEQVAALVARLKPAIVITSWARYSVDPSDFAVAAGSALSRFERDTGARIVVVRDTPRPPQNMAECLLAHPDDQSECAFPRAAAVARIGTGQVEVLSGHPGWAGVDLNDFVCPRDVCAPVIGDVVVYRDSNHLTDTYVRTLTPRLAAAL